MKDIIVTHVEMPGEDPMDYGLFKVKGLRRTVFRFQYLDNAVVKVENAGNVFLLDSPDSRNGEEIKLNLKENKIKRYENDIALLIKQGDTGSVFDRVI